MKHHIGYNKRAMPWSISVTPYNYPKYMLIEQRQYIGHSALKSTRSKGI